MWSKIKKKNLKVQLSKFKRENKRLQSWKLQIKKRGGRQKGKEK